MDGFEKEMKKIIFLFLIIGIFLAGCQNKDAEYLEWKNATIEYQNVALVVIDKAMQNQTEEAIALCDKLSKDMMKDSCYKLVIDTQYKMGNTLPVSVCDKVILKVKMPPKEVAERLGEKITDYQKEKERITNGIKRTKEMCYNMSK